MKLEHWPNEVYIRPLRSDDKWEPTKYLKYGVFQNGECIAAFPTWEVSFYYSYEWGFVPFWAH